jgi:ABC-type Zn2+ transport system substrate-binding protein/surface adhesin
MRRREEEEEENEEEDEEEEKKNENEEEEEKKKEKKEEEEEKKKKCRDLHLLPLLAVRPVQSLSACTRVRFTFFLPQNSYSHETEHLTTVMLKCPQTS